MNMLSKAKTSVAQSTKSQKDTFIVTIKQQYGKDFGVKNESKLEDYFNKNGYNSLSDLLKNE